MRNALSILKLLSAFFVICLYFISTAIFYPGIIFFPYATKKILNKIVSLYSRTLCLIFNINIEVDIDDDHLKGNHFIVANHLSYLDILVITTVLPTSFVTSVEMKKTFLLGQIVQLAGCLFVERRSRENITNEIKDIENALKKGLNVMVFPEATSTNGEQIIPFKRSLFQAAISTGTDILPITFNYTSVNGEPVTVKNRDLVCWYGDMTFFPHLWGLCQLDEVTVHIASSEKIKETHQMTCTAMLRDVAYERVAAKYSGIQ